MRISEELKEGLREQYNFELLSGYAYLQMAADLADKSWDGFSHFMMLQAKEEFEHAEKFYNFLNNIGYKANLDAIEKPKQDYNSVLEVFETALAHEEEVTSRIENLYGKSLDEKAYCVTEFLDWYLKEQVEEEDGMRNIIDTLKGIDGHFNGLYLFDKELGKR